MTPHFQPDLISKNKSLQLSTKTAKGEFLERVERDVLNRKDNHSKLIELNESKIIFQPNINNRSKKLLPRSSYDMSRGDLLRKETNNRMTRLKLQQEESIELTFQPEISKKVNDNIQIKSIIKTMTDNGQFINWYNDKKLLIETKKLQLDEERKQKELETCTFNPITKNCPAYIKRIAKSMAIVKATKNDGMLKINDKPEWK